MMDLDQEPVQAPFEYPEEEEEEKEEEEEEEEDDDRTSPPENRPEASNEEDEEEDECRVCRGPAEEGRPLFGPCKCSGSIGLTHQDCLVSWLEVTRGDGRCELCKTKFRFDPQYAENTPDHLPVHEVVLGLSSRFIARWLPFALRIFVAASLWLLIAPLLTSCIYHGWMHRPASIIPRITKDIIPFDIVSGAIIASIIIISFLSLMSFADFLRVHWQQPRPEDGNDDQPRRNGVEGGFGEDENPFEQPQGTVDDNVLEYLVRYNEARSKEIGQQAAAKNDSDDQYADSFDEGNGNQRIQNTEEGGLYREDRNNIRVESVSEDESEEGSGGMDGYDLVMNDEDDMESGSSDDDLPPPLEGRNQADFPDGGNNAPQNEIHDQAMNENDEARLAQGLNEERAFDPMDPVLQDDQVDMEINVALDELLGLRGPMSTLVRNLLWLLAFNATYLGIFAFVPKAVGSTVYSKFLNTTTSTRMLQSIPYMYSDTNETSSVVAILDSLNEESINLNTTFRLPDVATVTLGYFSIAAMIVMTRYCWFFSEKLRKRLAVDGAQANGHQRLQFDENDGDRILGMGEADPPENAPPSTAVGVALDATVAVVKVGILLFLKMFFLPLTLGLWLDGSTMSLFGHTISQRVVFAGTDLFSFVLLHWVAGITFMLLVTVFLLQLREVAHPALLARLIRPQEPQPDLLGNLMNETVLTHMKRMFLSLGIYAPLLTLHVTLPVKIFIATGLADKTNFFHLQFWHLVMPQMQIPLELIVFHLSMLALLERYKNSIGGLQHKWMLFMCKQMKLSEFLLPRSIAKFELIGSKNLFSRRQQIDNEHSKTMDKAHVDDFYYKLANKETYIEDFIESNIQYVDGTMPVVQIDGESKSNGQRIIEQSTDFIHLPQDANSKTELLPTSIGKFRLRPRLQDDISNCVVEFWKEIPGDAIPRPPEGWDDLGAGGAFVQGRWAWGKEKKSVVENSVAQATAFRKREKEGFPIFLILKVLALLLMSWMAVTLTVFGILSAPLAVGRSFYYLFRVPSHYIHDPLAFCIGGCLFFPTVSFVVNSKIWSERPFSQRLSVWISKFRIPPVRKLFTFSQSFFLWFLLSPLSLGISYEIFAVKTSGWFSGKEPLIQLNSVLLCWVLGFVVLHTWAFLAYFSVFTKGFWTNVGNGILEPPVEDNLEGEEVIAEAGGVVRHGIEEVPGRNEVRYRYKDWQGVHGRVARFFRVYRAVFFDWDWESVENVVLLDEFTRPIARQLASALVGSTLSFQFSLFLVPLIAKFEEGNIMIPLIGATERGMFRLILFRLCMTIHVTVQVCSVGRARLESWFRAAHDAARDDRYLIGEILMNFEPDQHDS